MLVRESRHYRTADGLDRRALSGLPLSCLLEDGQHWCVGGISSQASESDRY